MKINREMKNINRLINFNLCHSMILWFWMKILISDFFFFEKKRDTIKRLLQFISRTKLRRERHTHTRDAEYHPADFKENLYTEMHPPLEFLDFFHGGITLCIYVIPLFYPHFFFPPPLTLSLSLSYLHPFFRLSFRILIIPVALFSFFSFFFFSSLLYPCKHIERTRPKEEIIAFWHRGIASISRYCSRRSRLLHFITAELRCCCKSASFKKAWYCTRIIMTGCVLYFQKRGGVEGGKRANISRLPGIEGKRW